MLCFFVGLSATGCEKKQAVQQAGPPEVAVVAVSQQDVPVHSEFVATTDGLVNATILAQVQGYLVRQVYREGEFVQKGDALFEIDPRPFQVALEQAKAVQARQQAVLQTAKANLNRILPLAAANAVSQKDKDDAIGSVEAAEAQLLAAKAEVRKAELDLSFTKITSPISGVAGAAKTQLGDLVGTPQNQVLTTVSTVNPIKVYMPISEREYLRQMEERKQKAPEAEKTSLQLILADGSVWPHSGQFEFVDRQADPTTGTLKVAALFANPDNLLRPGQYARVRVLMKTRRGALVVPQRAVSDLQGSYQVAVVKQDDTVEIRTVKVGERFGSLWVIDEGLNPGERVVAEGAQKVRNGAKVVSKPFEGEPKPPAASTSTKS